MLVADGTLVFNAELALEAGLGKTLTPNLVARVWASSRVCSSRTSSPSVSIRRVRSAGEQFAGDGLEGAAEILEPGFGAQTRRCRMAPIWRSGRDYACPRISASRRCRPRMARPEPLSSPVLPRANAMTGRWYRSLRREANADHALVPVRIEQAQAVAIVHRHPVHPGQRRFLHVASISCAPD
jgi:hypothetical protein